MLTHCPDGYECVKKQEIILYDKYKKIDQYESISVISNIWEKSIVECIDKIIIVSYSWQEIYSECINNQIEDKKIQIFDISDQMLKSYYTMCYDNYTFYQNSLKHKIICLPNLLQATLHPPELTQRTQVFPLLD